MSIITIVRTETIILVYTDDGKEEIEKVEEKKHHCTIEKAKKDKSTSKAKLNVWAFIYMITDTNKV